MLFSKDIGIDLGTANILIYEKGKGIVLEEPSVVSKDAQTGKIIAAGEEARQMIGRTPGKIEVIRPMRDGVIADIEATESMLKEFIRAVSIRGIFSQKPTILICCPSNITLVEKNAIREAAERCGAREVIIEEESKVAALGAGMDISKPSGNMIIDIGGGTTDVAVLSLGDIVTSTSIKIAGNRFDQDIIDYIKTNYKLLIGDRTSEEIKVEVATVYPKGREAELQVRGRDLVSGLPRTITVTSEEVEESLRESVRIIIHATKNVLEQTPPELSADIMDKGIVLTGGGALLHGLDRLLADELNVPVFVADNPLHCVAIGTGIMLDHIDKLRRR